MMAIAFGLIIVGAFVVAVMIGFHKDKHRDE
jgi:hypothetical protein